MISALILLVLGVLLLSSYLDLKYKAVPSIFLTSTIFVALMLRPENFLYGIITFVFALVIRDVQSIKNMEFGVADIKIMTIIGLLLSSAYSLALFFAVFLIFQLGYTVIWRLAVSKKGEMPFIPCLTAVYIVLAIIGGLA